MLIYVELRHIFNQTIRITEKFCNEMHVGTS